MGASSDDYYALLGIDSDADDEVLRQAWRRLALEWHPDRAGPQATADFQRISIAYSVLSDPGSRAAYDRRHGIARGAPEPPLPTRHAPGVMLSRLSSPLNSLLARGVARHAEPNMIELFLEPEEIAEGGMVTIAMRVAIHCPKCIADRTAPCPLCNGERIAEDLYSAWLAVRPGVADGTILTPSARMPGMLHPISFRVRHA